MAFAVATILGIQTSQAVITFNFNYTDAAGTGWYDPTYGQQRRDALMYSANMLGQYFNATATIGYTVTSINNLHTNTLASAGSDLNKTNVFGFQPTVVQYKIENGYTGPMSYTDGSIEWNFGYSWNCSTNTSFGISAGEYDFVSTAMHELLHSFGFLSFIDSNGTGALGKGSGTADLWSTFDKYLTTSNGVSLINPTTYAFDTNQLGVLTGGAGVLRFSGTNATVTFPSGVPIYAPTNWSGGSSISHTDDLTFDGSSTNTPSLMMNAKTDTGPGLRTLSSYELGILTDIGYSMVPEPGSAMLCLAGSFAAVVRRRCRRKPVEAKAQ